MSDSKYNIQGGTFQGNAIGENATAFSTPAFINTDEESLKQFKQLLHRHGAEKEAKGLKDALEKLPKEILTFLKNVSVPATVEIIKSILK